MVYVCMFECSCSLQTLNQVKTIPTVCLSIGSQALLASIMQELQANVHRVKRLPGIEALRHLRQLQLRDHHS